MGDDFIANDQSFIEKEIKLKVVLTPLTSIIIDYLNTCLFVFTDDGEKMQVSRSLLSKCEFAKDKIKLGLHWKEEHVPLNSFAFKMIVFYLQKRQEEGNVPTAFTMIPDPIVWSNWIADWEHSVVTQMFEEVVHDGNITSVFRDKKKEIVSLVIFSEQQGIDDFVTLLRMVMFYAAQRLRASFGPYLPKNQEWEYLLYGTPMRVQVY